MNNIVIYDCKYLIVLCTKINVIPYEKHFRHLCKVQSFSLKSYVKLISSTPNVHHKGIKYFGIGNDQSIIHHFKLKQRICK